VVGGAGKFTSIGSYDWSASLINFMTMKQINGEEWICGPNIVGLDISLFLPAGVRASDPQGFVK
jgi:hypothetical protein